MSEPRDASLAESVPANTPAWSASGLVTQGGSSSTGAAAQGLTSSPSPRRLAAIVIEIVLLALVAIAVLVLGLAMAGPAVATTPAEVNVESRDWALSWREQAVRVRARALRHTRALGVKAPEPVPRMQVFVAEDGSEYVDWADFGTALKRQTQNWREYAIPRWHRRIFAPGGSGVARWAPLLRWCGLPEAWMHRSLTIMRGESDGNPLCVYAGHYGLFQYTPAWWAGKWDWRSPYHQCRTFVRAVKAGGWCHWRSTDRGW